ncbi:MAG: hypothetical protein ACLSAP_05160 [Oscillospiraceae bacterium]
MYEIESLIADIGALKNPNSRSSTASTYEEQALQQRYDALSDVRKPTSAIIQAAAACLHFEAQQSEE